MVQFLQLWTNPIFVYTLSAWSNESSLVITNRIHDGGKSFWMYCGLWHQWVWCHAECCLRCHKVQPWPCSRAWTKPACVQSGTNQHGSTASVGASQPKPNHEGVVWCYLSDSMFWKPQCACACKCRARSVSVPPHVLGQSQMNVKDVRTPRIVLGPAKTAFAPSYLFTCQDGWWVFEFKQHPSKALTMLPGVNQNCMHKHLYQNELQ